MHGPGHVGASLVSYAPLATALLAAGRERLAVAGGVVAVACSTLPDVDQFVPGLEHRGPTHTLWFVVAAGAALSAVGAWIAIGVRVAVASRARGSVRPAAAIAGIAGVLSVATHVAVDALTPMGIRPLAPLRNRDVCFDVVYSRDRRANLLSLAAGVVATALAVVVGRLCSAGR